MLWCFGRLRILVSLPASTWFMEFVCGTHLRKDFGDGSEGEVSARGPRGSQETESLSRCCLPVSGEELRFFNADVVVS
jgi:hypothetical protein